MWVTWEIDSLVVYVRDHCLFVIKREVVGFDIGSFLYLLVSVYLSMFFIFIFLYFDSIVSFSFRVCFVFRILSIIDT